MPTVSLSDKALSVFTFAAYHSFVSGDPVREVVLDDGNGHHADPDGIEELETARFIETGDGRGRFTESGIDMLGRTIEAIRGAAS